MHVTEIELGTQTGNYYYFFVVAKAQGYKSSL